MAPFNLAANANLPQLIELSERSESLILPEPPLDQPTQQKQELQLVDLFAEMGEVQHSSDAGNQALVWNEIKANISLPANAALNISAPEPLVASKMMDEKSGGNQSNQIKLSVNSNIGI